MNGEYDDLLLKLKEQMISERKELIEKANAIMQKAIYLYGKINAIEKLATMHFTKVTDCCNDLHCEQFTV